MKEKIMAFYFIGRNSSVAVLIYKIIMNTNYLLTHDQLFFCTIFALLCVVPN